MKKLILFNLFFSLSLISIAQNTDSEEIVAIKGEVNSTQFLVKNHQVGEKTYKIYWFTIDLKIDSVESDSLTKQLINSKTTQHTILPFVSPTSGLKSDFERYKKYKKGDFIEFEVRLLDLIKYLNKESETILVKSIKL